MLFTYGDQPLGFERLLNLSMPLKSFPADQIHSMIEATEKSLCAMLGPRSGALALWDDSTKVFAVNDLSAGNGDSVHRVFTPEQIPWISSLMFQDKVIHFANPSELSEAAAKDIEALFLVPRESATLLPLRDGERRLGVLCFGTSRAEIEWPQPFLRDLSAFADVVANTLSRDQLVGDLVSSVSSRQDERMMTSSSALRVAEAALSDLNLQLIEANKTILDLKGKLRAETVLPRRETRIETNLHAEIVGQSPALLRILRDAERVANTDSTVLLLGETGTGKELIARTIHRNSKRKGRAMVNVNCAALPASLVENELFGRERGAYTGALTREAGRFELADRSTIFLDEVGELPLELQSKLLRVLQEGEFGRLGSPKTIHVDVRVIAATSRDLEAAVSEGKFREDLYYRLNVFPIRVPPLRERREDIPMIAWHFLRVLGDKMGRDVEAVQTNTMKALEEYPWPGNIRELRNVIERNLITQQGSVFSAEMPEWINGSGAGAATTIEQVERAHITRMLERCGWRVRGPGGASQALGLKPTTLEARMKKLGIFRH
jgi:transcriptional regulator with GAF, ATPase, and Fis domain